MHQVVWDFLIDYGRLEWQRTFHDMQKKTTPDVAYEDVLNEIDKVWCVKGLIAICNNLLVTWKVRPHIGTIS